MSNTVKSPEWSYRIYGNGGGETGGDSSGGENTNNAEMVLSIEKRYNGDGIWHFLKKLPEEIDVSNLTSLSEMFYSCRNLEGIPKMNTSNIIDMRKCFMYCVKITTIPQIDTSNVTDMEGLFNGCWKLETVPQMNTTKVTKMDDMFRECKVLKTIPQIDTSKVIDMSYMFYDCNALESIPELDASSVTNPSNIFYRNTYLTDIGGFLNLGKAYTNASSYSGYTLKLSSASALTHDSLMNVINKLYDLNLTYDVANGGTLYQQTLNLGATHLAKLTEDELQIAYDKGWKVT